MFNLGTYQLTINLYFNYHTMNNNMDNYISELQKGDTIEFEGDYYIYRFTDGDYINCDNMEYFTVNAFYEDLEFGNNRTFKEFITKNNLGET